MLLQGSSFLKRASTDKLREVFLKYASLQKDGDYYMTSEDFVRKFLGLFTDATFNDVSILVHIHLYSIYRSINYYRRAKVIINLNSIPSLIDKKYYYKINIIIIWFMMCVIEDAKPIKKNVDIHNHLCTKYVQKLREFSLFGKEYLLISSTLMLSPSK